ncbi:unnamed protein product [Diatraea saccharalis]|uniref:N-acetylneuraminate lyase n=1 Tax=Diatraea saccharalis TaxID=40085 RepID=A0A9N9R3P4_9NEOP|nr:unnamed protein product [Diatraea saccharalis]
MDAIFGKVEQNQHFRSYDVAEELEIDHKTVLTHLKQSLKHKKVHFSVKGIIAPVFAPIDEHGQLNLDVIPEYAKHLSENRVDGVVVVLPVGRLVNSSTDILKTLVGIHLRFVLRLSPMQTVVGGTSGEAMCLSVEERQSLLEAWISSARPLGLKVMAQVGGAPMPDVLALANHAELVMADGMMTLPELYFKPKTPTKLVDYLEEISAAAPTVPLIYYHFPAMSGVDMNMPELYREATRRIPNFKGFKADLNVAVQLEELLAPDHRVFIANHLLAPSVLMGHASSIATVTNLFPSLIRDLVDSASSSNPPTSLMRKQSKLNSMVAAITDQGKWEFVPSMKVAMELITGISVGDPRKPLTALDQQQRDIMVMRLNKIIGN